MEWSDGQLTSPLTSLIVRKRKGTFNALNGGGWNIMPRFTYTLEGSGEIFFTIRALTGEHDSLAEGLLTLATLVPPPPPQYMMSYFTGALDNGNYYSLASLAKEEKRLKSFPGSPKEQALRLLITASGVLTKDEVNTLTARLLQEVETQDPALFFERIFFPVEALWGREFLPFLSPSPTKRFLRALMDDPELKDFMVTLGYAHNLSLADHPPTFLLKEAPEKWAEAKSTNSFFSPVDDLFKSLPLHLKDFRSLILDYPYSSVMTLMGKIPMNTPQDHALAMAKQLLALDADPLASYRQAEETLVDCLKAHPKAGSKDFWNDWRDVLHLWADKKHLHRFVRECNTVPSMRGLDTKGVDELLRLTFSTTVKKWVTRVSHADYVMGLLLERGTAEEVKGLLVGLTLVRPLDLEEWERVLHDYSTLSALPPAWWVNTL